MSPVNLSKLPIVPVCRGESIESERCRVSWENRDWLLKIKKQSANEIAGYQIADYLTIPVQPWAACFKCESKSGSSDEVHTAILVEWWPSISSIARLCEPAKSHPTIVACALALAVFDRHEWPGWLMDNAGNLRLHDLDFIGPPFPSNYPEQSLSDYRDFTESAFSEAQASAHGTGLAEAFAKALREIQNLDFAAILDFGGHPDADAIVDRLVVGLAARQSALSRLL